MAWRIVKQPNGKYARFSDPVDNFTHYDMTREEAVKYCQDEIGLKAGETKVLRADEEPGRWEDSLETIEAIHGIEERLKVHDLILTPELPPNPALVQKSKYPDSYLQHASACTSQYDSTCRGLATELLATRNTLRELLKCGEHEGDCTNAGYEDTGPCQLHFEASERRELAAYELLKGTDA